jgi:hypothetical protein
MNISDKLSIIAGLSREIKDIIKLLVTIVLVVALASVMVTKPGTTTKETFEVAGVKVCSDQVINSLEIAGMFSDNINATLISGLIVNCNRLVPVEALDVPSLANVSPDATTTIQTKDSLVAITPMLGSIR